MMNGEERRTQGLGRVSVQALVEICGRDVGGAPAFEAESIDVSGRGMHVRTAYLPDIGAPLVCRFENGGNEIVVEGVVAWRSEAERGGEFGIQFTALDSGSVQALEQLCGIGGGSGSQPDADEPAVSPSSEAGSRVRLHIDGLGSPMKACVRQGSQKELRVSSNLEFLKVGRHLEIEDLGNNSRRGAQIGGVDVVIDPQTRVPQLVVSLRYDGAEEMTPEPSVIDSSQVAERSPLAAAAAVGAFTSSASAHTDDDEEAPMPDEGDEHLAPAEELDEEAQAMRGKLALFAVDAGAAAKRGGAMFARMSAAAAGGIGSVFRQAGSKLGDIKRRKQGEAPRRTTSAPASEVLSAQGRRLRPQMASQVDEEAPPTMAAPDLGGKKKRVKRIAAASAFAVLLVAVGVIAMKKPAAPPGAAADGKAPATVAVAANPAGADVVKVDEQGNPIRAKLTDEPAAAAATGGVSADVPLFGPTPMATMEPAPLGAAPEEGAPAAEGDTKTEEAAEKAAASAAADDESFGSDGENGEKAASPGDVPPWGHGKLEEPIVFRLRLDKPGSAIQGAINPTGFTVNLPGVKVMESTKAITDRDSRIAKVKAKNSSSGAEITFQFKDGIPGYKVRLRKDYVEFFISNPGGDTEAGVASAKKSSKKHGKKAKKASNEPKPAANKNAAAKPKKKGKKKSG
jgi:hypothetical protein